MIHSVGDTITESSSSVSTTEQSEEITERVGYMQSSFMIRKAKKNCNIHNQRECQLLES